MREFEEWFDDDVIYSEEGVNITETVKDYAGEAWNHQQKKIDELEKELDDTKKCLNIENTSAFKYLATIDKLTKALEFVVKQSGTSTDYNLLARTTLAELKESE